MRFTLRHAILAVLAAWCLVALLPLGARPLIAPDETRYGLIGWEMASSSDWFLLRMDGFRYYEKPPLAYWLMAASIDAFGVNAFAIRLPSSVAALGWSLCALVLAWRWRRDAVIAAVAGVAALTMVMPAILSTVAVLDGPFSALVAWSMLAGALAATTSGRSRIVWGLCSGGLAGLAVLTKGFLGLALPVMVLAPWLVVRREWRAFASVAVLALGGLIIVAGPLAWMLHRSEPEFWKYFFLVEHVRRFINPDPNQHAEPWWYFVAMLPIMLFPWVLRAPEALRSTAARVRSDEWMLLCVCWVVFPLLFFSLANGKLPTYLLPITPACAAWLAVGVDDWTRSRRNIDARRGSSSGAALLLVVLAMVAGVALLTGLGGWPAWRLWTDAPTWKALFVVATFTLWAVLEWCSKLQRERTPQLLWGAAGALPLAMCYPLLLPDAMLPDSKVPMRPLESVAVELRAAPRVIADVNWAHAVALAGRRTDVAIVGGASEFDNELGDTTEQARLVPWTALEEWMASPTTSAGDMLLIYDPLRAPAPEWVRELTARVDRARLRVVVIPAR